MPNGFQGSEAQWRRMEAPLVQLDPVLEKFASAHKLKLSKNYHGEPERSLRWDTAVECLIQLFLADADQLTFNLWLCASQDRGDARYWRREFLFKDQKLAQYAERLPDLLDEGFVRVNSWGSDTLEFATTIRR